jgi:hypothetical protein
MSVECTTPLTETCCPGHISIAVLSDHLIAGFYGLGAAHVMGVVLDAQRARGDLPLSYVEVLASIEQEARRTLLNEAPPCSDGHVIAQRTA